MDNYYFTLDFIKSWSTFLVTGGSFMLFKNASVISLVTISLLLLASLEASRTSAQSPPAGKCQICTFLSCEGQLTGSCLNSATNSKCTLEGTECPYTCVENIGCRTASVDPVSGKATTCAPPSVKSIRLLQNEPQQEASDSEIREDLLKVGAAGVRMDKQLKGPVTLISAKHSSKDLMEAGEVLNLSEKSVKALRLGWTIKTPGQPDEAKVGAWIAFSTPLEADRIMTIPAQKMDTAPLWTPGTIVRVYVTEVKFQDGTSWERGPEQKPGQIQNSLVLTLQSEVGR